MPTETVLLSDLAQKLLYLAGEPFSLADYPMYKTIYDGRYKRTVLMCGRQVAKSTSIANFMITESISIPFFHEYYVSPSKEQTLIFSNTRVGKTLAYSPYVRKYFQSTVHSDRVLHREYTNGSENAFTYACDDADRARGFSADRVCYDEFQDMVYDAVVPVINACMKNSDYRFEMYAGTPKTMEGSLQYLWERSSQSEWAMKCAGCGKYNIAVSEKIIGKNGPCCLKCGRVLNPRTGVWVDFKKPDIDEESGEQIKAFHIPQIIMPANIEDCYSTPKEREAARSRWRDILKDVSLFSTARIRNEIVGVSDAVGTRLITLEELQSLCTGGDITDNPHANALRRECTFVVAGIDWSGGGTTGVSRTVLWIWGWSPSKNKLLTLFFKIFSGNNPADDVGYIGQLLGQYGVTMVGADAGEGALPNSTLRNTLGHHRVMMINYCKQSMPWKWNGIDRYTADRTTMIDNYLMLCKRKGVELPPYHTSKPAVQDILNVYEEVTKNGHKVWTHSPALPDDCLHAQIFGWLAYKMVITDFTFYA